MHNPAPKVLTVREVTGRIEAILSWIPDLNLRTEAEGTQLHLASHVLDPTDGRVILFDGPRAAPCQGPDGKLCVLLLVVPDPPGRYRIQIEPVVEDRFWGSDRGYTPLMLDLERKLDGSVQFDCATSNCRPLLTRKPPTTFSIDTPLYGLNDSERCVEIPWVIAKYRGESRVLDLGYATAEPRYLLGRSILKIPCLIGLDQAAVSQSGVLGVAGDASAAPFQPGMFDAIFAISVIERIGRDNFRDPKPDRPLREFGDLEAASNLALLLRPAGRFLVTVPFGRLEDHGDFVQYDLRRIVALLEATGCDLTLAEYYRYGVYGWFGPVDPLTLSDVAYRTGAGAGAIACLELTRRNRPTHKERALVYAKPAHTATNGSSSLSATLSPQTAQVLKLSGAWSKMRGETAQMRPVMLFC